MLMQAVDFCDIACMSGSLDICSLALLLCSSISTKEGSFEGIDQFNVERKLLFDVLTECRVVSCYTLLSQYQHPHVAVAMPATSNAQFVEHLSMLQRKTPEELEILHYANQVASAAHVQVAPAAHAVPCCACCALLCMLFPAVHAGPEFHPVHRKKT